MKITQISAIDYSSRSLFTNRNNDNEPPNTETQPSFKGLWGKDLHTNNIDYDSFSGSETTDRYYYPFLDETSEEIKNIEKTYSRTTVNHNGGQGTVYYYENCHINDKLPFTRSEWAQYVKNKLSLNPSTRVYIEETLKRFDLKRHLIR